MNDRIKQLQKEIELERHKMSNCKHEFSKPFYDPEIVKEGYGSVQDGAGSDPHWSYAGYRDVKKDRWTKKCIHCGFEMHTYEQKPIITGYEPKF
jgi:hypothetical protein